MKKFRIISTLLLPAFLMFFLPCRAADMKKPVHADVPFIQDYSIKYYFNQPDVTLYKVVSDRNGKIQVLSSTGLLHPHGGEFLYPGTLEPDGTYRPMADKSLAGIGTYKEQLVYLDKEAVLSNAWAGELFSKHQMPAARLFAGGDDFTFLVAEGRELKLVKNSEQLWMGSVPEQVIEVKHAGTEDRFWILTTSALYAFTPGTKNPEPFYKGKGFTSFDLVDSGEKQVIGTKNGYIEINNNTQQKEGQAHTKVPVPEITVVREVNGNVWFGTPEGAFMMRNDGEYNYYYGERWLPGNIVTDIAAGPDSTVLILTDKGLGQIFFKEMTLHTKALYFEDQVRKRHIRHGFNSTLEGMKDGNLSTGFLADSDNDGLWTSMYLGSQVFRYEVEKSEEALQNITESLDAMERLYTVNPVPGFPSRSFERSGYIEILSDPERWQHSADPEWDWKATTSSDEAIGHVFVFGAIAELIDVEPVRDKAIRLLDELMQHVVDNDFYLIDYDGKPTLWGKWHPDYVNGFPTSIGDRKLNSSNIVAMLQTAYHFTGKEIYKEKAFELMHKHGYLENLMRPMEEIGKAPEGADDWSTMLSESWNHSDDEMYFLGYWGLYRYAFNDTLKAMFRESIIDHWEHERPEKDGLWNLFAGMVTDDFDLDEAIWYLQEHPLDLIQWDIQNSHRQDIEPMEPNFRNQEIKEVLPPDERPVQRHNANMFRLDRTGSNGTSEFSAGDIWLLPYWLGRYLGVIVDGK
jgi:hypothetical protein